LRNIFTILDHPGELCMFFLLFELPGKLFTINALKANPGKKEHLFHRRLIKISKQK